MKTLRQGVCVCAWCVLWVCAEFVYECSVVEHAPVEKGRKGL